VRGGILVLLAAAALAAAGCGGRTPTSRVVRAGQLGPVRLAESRAAVERTLGAGTVVARYPRFAGSPPVIFVEYADAELIVRYAGDRGRWTAVEAQTVSPSYRTASGVGVGSAADELEAAGVECSEQIEGQAVCALGRPAEADAPASEANGPVTLLYVKSDHVDRVYLLPAMPADPTDPDAGLA
jgi:hypothetical protein